MFLFFNRNFSYNPAVSVPQGLPGQPPIQPPPEQQKILKLSSAQQPILTPKQIQNATVIAVQAKKKALKLAGETVLKGAERLQKPTEKIADFHQELLLLRQHYRLRRHGEKILGDLSFRTAGSMFNEQSTFEVIRDTGTGSEYIIYSREIYLLKDTYITSDKSIYHTGGDNKKVSLYKE